MILVIKVIWLGYNIVKNKQILMSNILCEYTINISDIINENVSILISTACVVL